MAILISESRDAGLRLKPVPWLCLDWLADWGRSKVEARRTESAEVAAVQERVRGLVASEADERVMIRARVRLGGERGVDLAREYGYRSGAGVTRWVRRLEAATRPDRKLKAKLESLREHASRKL